MGCLFLDTHCHGVAMIRLTRLWVQYLLYQGWSSMQSKV
jgi:hypothetical protein